MATTLHRSRTRSVQDLLKLIQHHTVQRDETRCHGLIGAWCIKARHSTAQRERRGTAPLGTASHGYRRNARQMWSHRLEVAPYLPSSGGRPRLPRQWRGPPAGPPSALRRPAPARSLDKRAERATGLGEPCASGHSFAGPTAAHPRSVGQQPEAANRERPARQSARGTPPRTRHGSCGRDDSRRVTAVGCGGGFPARPRPPKVVTATVSSSRATSRTPAPSAAAGAEPRRSDPQ